MSAGILVQSLIDQKENERIFTKSTRLPKTSTDSDVQSWACNASMQVHMVIP